MDEGGAGRTSSWCRILSGQTHPSRGDATASLLQKGALGSGNTFLTNWYICEFHNTGSQYWGGHCGNRHHGQARQQGNFIAQQ